MNKDHIQSGDVISYLEMCSIEGANLQRGMNFRFRNQISVILMSIRKGAPYNDEILEDGRILIYEGHDEPKRKGIADPKALDQPMQNPTGTLTQNGLFYQAAEKYKAGSSPAEHVKVYEKIRSGVWVYNGIFELVDAWKQNDGRRAVFKFKLMVVDDMTSSSRAIDGHVELHHTRMIPSSVKLEVWKRDQGKCVQCGSTDNLHFDHIIPFSKGGSSLTADNIQLLCARHNLEKKDQIK